MTPGRHRVLLVDPSDRGGIASYTAMVAQALLAAGAAPALLAPRGLREVPAGLPVSRRLPTLRWGRPEGSTAAFLARRTMEFAASAAQTEITVRRRAPDVIHFQAGFNRRFDAGLLRRLRRLHPVVWTAHDVLPFETTTADRDRFASIYRAVDRVIVHTAPAAELVRELSGVDAVVVEHPVPSGVIRVDPAPARERLGLAPEGRLLGALGFVRDYKGYDLLADVWEQLGEDAPALLLMGEAMGSTRPDAVSRLGRHPRVQLRLGYAPEADLQLAANAVDALLLPYTTASDSGLVHLARAVGRPVIASDAPQLAASVRATGSGSVVPRVLSDWSAAVTGSLPPRPPAAPTPEQSGRAHLDVYRSVLGG